MTAKAKMLLTLAGAVAMLSSLATHAAVNKTQTTTFEASTNIVDQCNAVTATAMSFPTYQPDAATPSTANSTIKVKCTKNSAITISLDKGTTTGGTTSVRKMRNAAGSTLDYGLYSDAAFNQNWDDGTNKVSATGVGLSTDLVFTVYGRIPVSQLDSEPGSYTDTITVTVGY